MRNGSGDGDKDDFNPNRNHVTLLLLIPSGAGTCIYYMVYVLFSSFIEKIKFL